MNRLPEVRIEGAREWQRQRLARWLAEWQIDCLLAEDDPASAAPGGASVQAAEEEPVAVGQVRLLYPCSAVACERPRYFTVLKVFEKQCLVAPFSRFAEPAVPGEWLTGLDALHVRVLCLWNARVLPDSLVRQSWVVDSLSDAALQDAGAVYRLIAEDTELPAKLVSDVGPPLEHPLDPRRQYMEEEREWMSMISPGWGRGRTVAFTPGGPSERRKDLPLAAEDREEYRTKPEDTGDETQDTTD